MGARDAEVRLDEALMVYSRLPGTAVSRSLHAAIPTPQPADEDG